MQFLGCLIEVLLGSDWCPMGAPIAARSSPDIRPWCFCYCLLRLQNIQIKQTSGRRTLRRKYLWWWNTEIEHPQGGEGWDHQFFWMKANEIDNFLLGDFLKTRNHLIENIEIYQPLLWKNSSLYEKWSISDWTNSGHVSTHVFLTAFLVVCVRVRAVVFSWIMIWIYWGQKKWSEKLWDAPADFECQL